MLNLYVTDKMDLIDAVIEGDYREVERLLGEGADINKHFEDYRGSYSADTCSRKFKL